MRNAIFLDRDGTINIDRNYVHTKEEWQWTEGAIEAIKGFNDLGFLVIVVTNQSGIARGFYTDDDVKKLHNYINKILSINKALIDEYYYCPHHPQYGMKENCQCRKPNIGMIMKAAEEFKIDLSNSFMIGDRITDVQTAINAGVKPVIVGSDCKKHEMDSIDREIIKVTNLLDAYKKIEKLCAKSK